MKNFVVFLQVRTMKTSNISARSRDTKKFDILQEARGNDEINFSCLPTSDGFKYNG